MVLGEVRRNFAPGTSGPRQVISPTKLPYRPIKRNGKTQTSYSRDVDCVNTNGGLFFILNHQENTVSLLHETFVSLLSTQRLVPGLLLIPNEQSTVRFGDTQTPVFGCNRQTQWRQSYADNYRANF